MDSTTHIIQTTNQTKQASAKMLKIAVTSWFVVAVIGQWIFTVYIVAFFGPSGLHGNFEQWNKALPKGYIAGEPMGNLAVILHLLFAVVILIGGPLQFIPYIQKHARTLHRWNGRIYLITAFVVSLSGVFMTWTRGGTNNLVQHTIITINAVLIMLFAILAWRYALARKFNIHRRWAFRMFLAAGGVWFFRIGLMLWLMIHQGPVGFDPKTFQGPFLNFLGVSQYLLPLAAYELYLYAQKQQNSTIKWVTSITLFFLTLMTAAGVFAATVGLWLPQL